MNFLKKVAALIEIRFVGTDETVQGVAEFNRCLLVQIVLALAHTEIVAGRWDMLQGFLWRRDSSVAAVYDRRLYTTSQATCFSRGTLKPAVYDQTRPR
jgi:hypothetical protein